MQFTAVAVLAFAATAFAGEYKSAITTAGGKNETVYTTVTESTYTTVCPASSTITYGSMTFTNTETVETTITVPCPTGCQIVKPVYTTSSVMCQTCSESASASVSAPAVGYPSSNGTAVTPPAKTSAVGQPAGTGSASSGQATSSGLTPTAGAGKTFAVSGGLLAGLLGLAAYVL